MARRSDFEVASGRLDAAIVRTNARDPTKIAVLRSDGILAARDFGPLIDASGESVDVERKGCEVLGLQVRTAA